MHHRRPRRLSAADYRGPNRYSLTFCTADRQRHFTSALAVDLVLGEFRYTAAHEGYAILVYCFMEDHVHLLVETESETADLQRFVKLMKQRSGFRFSKRFGQRLWQGSYFDRTLRSDEATEDAMRYILDNPVRAGLVRLPLEYPFMGSDYGPLEEILTDLGLRR
jgi:putative transposase